MGEIIEHRHPAWEVPSLVMNFLGGGWFGVFVVPIGIIVALCLRRLWASALYFGIASAVSALIVQLLKSIFDRPRPEEILVTADIGSFPSGHVANAATLAVALGLIVWRTWVWVAGAVYVLVMALSRTYLGAHWLSDTVGGMLVGAAVAMVLWIAFARRIRLEKERVGR
jgi:undecaprenyl-diphosphatase